MINLHQLIDIVRQASKLMLDDVFEITHKDGYTNIVTSSDIAVQNFLLDRLSRLLPGAGFICEEEDIHDSSHTHEYLWIIDPIDGTANYSRGIGQCAIAVGLRHHADMIMSVVYLPRTGELFYARRGEGAWLGDRRIHVSSRTFADAIMSTALPVYNKQYTAMCSAIINDVFLQCNDIRRFGAAAPELCYLAAGRTELYFEYQLQPWDFAAASLILTEAGGTLCTPSGAPIDTTAPSGILAANSPANLSRLLSLALPHLS